MDVGPAIGSWNPGNLWPRSILSFQRGIEGAQSGFPSKRMKLGSEDGMDWDASDEAMASEGVSAKSVLPLLSYISEFSFLYRMYGEPFRVDKNALCGKYLVFVCFYLPPDFSLDAEDNSLYPSDLIQTCADLYSYRDDFEMVLVSEMKDIFSPNAELLYNQTLVPFPSSSLVVQYRDFELRNYVCNFLQLVDPGFTCLFVNANLGVVHLGQPDSIVHHLKNLLQNSSFDALRSYERLVKSMWPVKSGVPYLPLTRALSPIARILKAVKPEYSVYINNMVSMSASHPIDSNQPFDVKFLLTGGTNDLAYLSRIDGETVEVEKAIRDKCIMVCCFYVPIFREDWDAPDVQSLSTTCSDLYATHTDFEMVVVAKMNRLADHREVFDHFLSGFHSPCLVIPFEHSERRNFICKYLDLDHPSSMQCLILDKGTDMKRHVLFHGYPSFAQMYGADAFPFDDKKLEELNEDDKLGWEFPRMNNLWRLLGCRSSDVLHKINAECGDDVVTISDLNEKVVGLFLCVEGNFIPMLKKVYEQCLTQHKSFEIVLVYIPFEDSLNPSDYQFYVDSLLQKHNLSLWRLPFDNTVSHKLRRLTRSPCDDQLIIIGANNAFIDPYGGEVMSSCGIDAYPFTREGLVQRELDKFKGLTLDSLLVYGSQDYVYKNDTKIPVSCLRGKNILLWIDSLSEVEFYHKLSAWYSDNQANSDFEVVFLRAHYSTATEDDLTLSKIMPWLVCPFHRDHSAYVEENLFTKAGTGGALVEFGTDGRVCSLAAQHLLDECGKIPFGRSNLRKDVMENFHSLYGFTLDLMY